MKDSIAEHYTHGQLLDRILSGVAAIGKTPGAVTVDELLLLFPFYLFQKNSRIFNRGLPGNFLCNQAAITSMQTPCPSTTGSSRQQV